MSDALLMADVVAPDGDREAEPVVVRSDGEWTTLVLDDGTSLVLRRRDLHVATAPPVETWGSEAA